MSADGECTAGKQPSYQAFVAVDANPVATVEIGHVPDSLAAFKQTVPRRHGGMRNNNVALGRPPHDAAVPAKQKRRAAATGNKLTEHVAALPFVFHPG